MLLKVNFIFFPIAKYALALITCSGVSGKSEVIITNGSPVNGMFRYNTTNAEFEGYQDGAWGAIAGSGGASAMETNNFTGDGSTRAFTISSAITHEYDLIIFIEAVYQNVYIYIASKVFEYVA